MCAYVCVYVHVVVVVAFGVEVCCCASQSSPQEGSQECIHICGFPAMFPKCTTANTLAVPFGILLVLDRPFAHQIFGTFPLEFRP